MLITLHCGGMSFNGTTIESKSLGGSESAAYYMAKELAKKGHRVTMFTNTDKESVTDDVRYVPCGMITEEFPLGEMFHYFAANTPTDVMIIQRHPLAFAFKWASKINLWWIHDLALRRNASMVSDQMLNIDGILTVSKWHKDQVCNVYGVNPDIVYPITNGVDLNLYEGEIGKNFSHYMPLEETKTKLLYTSRPERGLEYLVKPGGIMDRLSAIDSKYHLYVCAYDNVTPQMKNYYNMLYARIESMENVTNLGSLTKQYLADVMRQCDLHTYPSTFEETSCITAMECMAAGLPMIASHVGALPETVKGAGVALIDLKDETVDIDAFVDAILYATPENMCDAQKEKANYYSWFKAAERLSAVIEDCFAKSIVSDASIIKSLIQNSDYYAAKYKLAGRMSWSSGKIMDVALNELHECYKFTSEPVWDEHYKNYYQYEKDRGVNYGPENLDNNHRYLHISNLISSLPDGSTVVDYGCAHGHYTVNLAKRFPGKQFIGIDITQSNIDKATDWAKSENISNARFILGRVEGTRISSCNKDIALNKVDCIIAAEVLEHVANPGQHVDVLQEYLKDSGLMIITTPYGPWEAQGFKEHWPWRAHVHHFERDDLKDLWGHNNEFNVVNIPSGRSKFGDVIGSYVTTWKNTHAKSLSIDYDRKIDLIAPHQTVSCCIVVKDAPNSIRRCLESVMPYVDELVIGMDSTSSFETEDIIRDYMFKNWPEKSYVYESIESPLKTGFAEARNTTIAKASGDWILWIDSDEYLFDGHNLQKYLRNNQYNGYAIPQHHFSMSPLGIVKTDLPVRLFRSNVGIKFFGFVHEHPEQSLNAGVGFVTTIGDLGILHDGYKDEPTRRLRFSRNINLLLRDRKENPERELGKFLWLRDLAQMSQWELEDTGGQITDDMLKRCEEGVHIWLELLHNCNIRLAIDSLEFYSVCSRIIGNGFEMDVRLDTSLNVADSNSIQPITAYFNKREHAKDLLNKVFAERTKFYEDKYK